MLDYDKKIASFAPGEYGYFLTKKQLQLADLGFAADDIHFQVLIVKQTLNPTPEQLEHLDKIDALVLEIKELRDTLFMHCKDPVYEKKQVQKAIELRKLT